jgi:hypothetical protein
MRWKVGEDRLETLIKSVRFIEDEYLRRKKHGE